MNYYLDVLKDQELTYSAKVLFIYLYEMYFRPTTKVKKYGNYIEVDKRKAMKDLDMCETIYEMAYEQLEKNILIAKVNRL